MENKKEVEDLTLEELRQVVYELGIDDALENPNLTKEDLLDYYYDYIDND